ncbi:methylated-DNA--[protein]-cysteine S-methyltransferase [Streptomyces sp. NPDC047108]|uniref:methylated-DNA--[protein]-cysteine S-methyltransferase n=1 Tax=Streptomyces sp. NPDC047108 TaxID=3155025 RepID=UPI0033DE7567
MTTVTWTVTDSPIGPLLLAATPGGLVNVVFHADEETSRAARERLAARLGAEPVEVGSPAERRGGGGDQGAEAAPQDGAGGGAAEDRAAADRVLTEAVDQLGAYFDGTLRAFDLPLDWSLSGGFNRQVLRELADGVPYGTVVGYVDLAERVGEPGAARAVGVAMGSNPLPVVVACHRVVESGGGIGGFGGGLETKRALLALEGVLPQPLF